MEEFYVETPSYPPNLLGRVRVVHAYAPEGVWLDIPAEGLDLPFPCRIVEIEASTL